MSDKNRVHFQLTLPEGTERPKPEPQESPARCTRVSVNTRTSVSSDNVMLSPTSVDTPPFRRKSAPPAVEPLARTGSLPRTPPSSPTSIQTSPRVYSRAAQLKNFSLMPVVLGRGSFSVVRQALKTSSRAIVAVKEIDLNLYEDKFIIECKALGLLSHPNIVQFFEYERVGSVGYIFMECLKHPTLYEVLKEHPSHFQPLMVIGIVYQLQQALSEAHSKGVAHRDFKTNNIVYDHELKKATLFDFGLCWLCSPTEIDSVLLKDVVGSPISMPPEMLMRLPTNPFKGDVWALGVLLYELLYSHAPYSNCTNMRELAENYNNLPLPVSGDQLLQQWEHSILSLLHGCLDKDPEQRWNLEQIGEFLTTLEGKYSD